MPHPDRLAATPLLELPLTTIDRLGESTPLLTSAQLTIFKNIEDVVLVLNSDYRLDSLNPAAQSMLAGLSAQAVGRPISEILPNWDDLAIQLADSAEVQYAFWSLPTTQGQLRHFEVQNLLVKADGAAPGGYVLLMRDVTEHRQATTTLIESMNRFNEMINTITDSYYEADLTGKLTFVNDAFGAALGYSVNEVVGKSFRQFVDRQDHKRVFEVFNQVYRTGQPHEAMEYQYRRQGEPMYAQMSVSLIRDSAGAPAGFRGVIRDMTNKKLAERELLEAKEVAEVANRAKSTFLATVSHELRTPLTSVLGFAKIIKRRLTEVIGPALDTDDLKINRALEQVQANVDIIVSEGERLTALINNVLDLAKIESGKVQWQSVSVTIAEVIDRAMLATAALAEQKKLALQKEIAPDLPLVKGDPDRLLQVVINLISNAVKFTEHGSITCQAHRQENKIVVSVVDTGLGIPAEYHAKVFEQFVQVEDRVDGKPSGTGLGLPICKEIVEHHGGLLWVESVGERGMGSRFSFTLPVLTASDAVTSGSEVGVASFESLLSRLAAVSARSSVLGSQTVLIVDDEQNVRELLRQELSGAGYTVMEAGNGREALAQVKTVHPQLIILDIMMPELSGFDVAAVLKNDPETCQIPIIILSVVHDRERGYLIGVDRYLTKPVEMSDLLAEVGSLLHHRPGSRKVLVVEEDAQTRSRLQQVLEGQGWEVMTAATATDGIDRAVATLPDIVIANAGLAERYQLSRVLRVERGLKDLSFLLFH